MRALRRSWRYYTLGGNTLGVRQGASVSWLYGDHLGSTSASSGAAATSERYYAYGKDRGAGSLPTDHRFTGQISDASGLIFMNARYYDPVLGSFLSPDTVVPEPGQPEGYNRYAYANGNPLLFSDPSGHCSVPGASGFGGPSFSAESCGGGGGLLLLAVATTALAIGVADIAVTNGLDHGTVVDFPAEALPSAAGFPLSAESPNQRTAFPLSDELRSGDPGVVTESSAGMQVFADPSSAPSQWGNILFASILRQRMIAEQGQPEKGWEAHHIVAVNDPRANGARAILGEAGIDINDPVNGVFLPGTKGLGYTGPAAIHNKIHTTKYYEAVETLLESTGSEGVKSTLDFVRQGLTNGSFP
jgi:RHS repeat-associated protein